MTLTNDQIRDLCRRRDIGIVAASAATQPAAAALVAAVTPEDLQALVEDGTAARNRLVEANTGLVGVIVNRTQQEIPNAETMARTESDAIKIVLGAARKLI